MLPKVLASLTRFIASTETSTASRSPARSNRGAPHADADQPRQESRQPLRVLRGHHVGVRVPDYEAAKNWYTEKLTRVLQEWPYGDLQLAFSPAADDDFHLNRWPARFRTSNPSLTTSGEPGVRRLPALLPPRRQRRRHAAELIRRGVDIIGEPFEIEDISRRLAFFRDPWAT
jgi:lactoylglutathione lyase/glyoxylase I family protein